VNAKRVVLLDNEAVQALRDPAHRKHQRVFDEVEFALKQAVRTQRIRVAVPAAVRVEAGWDRTSPAWAFANRFRITDIPLDAGLADAAAAIVKRTGVSVADAHLGAAIKVAAADHITILTSDPGGMRRVAEGKRVDIVIL
jgi:predicted nucleic acid-binding protein